MEGRSRLKHLLSAVGFLIVAAFLYIHITYLLRPTVTYNRQSLLSFYNEAPSDIDTLVVGASGILVYWDPMTAYEETGMTSFSYACTAMHGTMFRYAIEEALKTQDPSLIIIDGRRFSGKKVQKHRDIVRNFTDSIDLNLTRLRALAYYCRTYKLSFAESASLFIDLCLYHNNIDGLFNPVNWSLIDNRVETMPAHYAKGFVMNGMIEPVTAPSEEILSVKEAGDIPEKTETVVRDLFSYLASLDKDILMVFTPMSVTEEQMMRYNALERLAAEYGIDTWNGNCADTELDYSTDFFNAHHTNVLGAEKVTKSLARYISENYGITDHREAGDRPEWDSLLASYHEAKSSVVSGMGLEPSDHD